MPERITLQLNGKAVSVAPGTTVAAAVLNAGLVSMHRSVRGEGRGPLCGMGICFECRLTVDGVPHVRSCQMISRDGMEIRTDE